MRAQNSGRDTSGRCEAIQYSDQMNCARCGLVWDVNDPEPPVCAKKIEAEYVTDPYQGRKP